MSRQLVQQLMKAADEAGCPVEPEIWVKRSVHGRFLPGSRMDQLEQNLFRYGKKGLPEKKQEEEQRQKQRQEQMERTKKKLGQARWKMHRKRKRSIWNPDKI